MCFNDLFQLEKMYELQDGEQMEITNNWRPLQDLGTRIVKVNRMPWVNMTTESHSSDVAARSAALNVGSLLSLVSLVTIHMLVSAC